MNHKAFDSTPYRLFFFFLIIGLNLNQVFSLDANQAFEEIDAFYNPKVDYSETILRVTDRDKSGHLLKTLGEDGNVRFLRSGDELSFIIPNMKKAGKCTAFVRSSEKQYVVIYVKDPANCYSHEGNIRLGTILKVFSMDLAKRIREASMYRVMLLKRKEDYINQLKDINNFIWAYKEKRVQVASDFDRKILELQKEKEKALSYMTLKKKDSLIKQEELALRIDQLDKDLDYYKIDRRELYADRWFMDHDEGKPVHNRPQAIKEVPRLDFDDEF